MRFLRENSLSLFFGALLLASVAGQSVAGQHQYNADATEHGEKAISWTQYVVTPEFGGDLLENWQSEFLQFSLYIVATVWLLQRGSNESKSSTRRVGSLTSSRGLANMRRRIRPPGQRLQAFVAGSTRTRSCWS